MGKASSCLKMLQILNSGRLFKISEIADLLETNARNVIEYKKELESMGYYIKSEAGRYGGYRIENSVLIPSIKLKENEKEAVVEGYNYALSKKDFLKRDEYIAAMGKVFSSISLGEPKSDLIVVDKYQLSMDVKEIEKRYRDIEKAIAEKHVLEVEYFSLHEGKKVHILDPYKLIIYNNSWFFLAWDEDAGDVLYFKVNRVINIKDTNKKFTVWKYFKAENYFDAQGFKTNGEYEHVVFIARNIRARLMQERVYGKNQTIEEVIDENTIKISLDMQNRSAIVSYVLGCGKELTVLEPQWLIDEVKEQLESIKQLYQ